MAEVINEKTVNEEPSWKGKLDKIRGLLAPLSTEVHISKSREDFMKRLETFKPSMWCGKPVDPPQCARYGWNVVKPDVLHCQDCGEYLCADMPPLSNITLYKESSKKLKEKLLSSHGKFCPWPMNPTSESVLALPALSNKLLVQLLREQATVMKQCVKRTNFDWKDFDDTATEIFCWLPKILDMTCQTDILKLILVGWKMEKNSCKLFCSFCSRTWFPDSNILHSNKTESQVLKPTAHQGTQNDEFEEEQTEASVSKRRKLDSAHVNPVLQHQPWCAWRNKDHGWMIYYKQLKKWHSSQTSTAHMDKANNTIESLRQVRQMLGTSQHPVSST